MTLNATLGRSIRMFLVDGTANSLITAEIMNWTGHALVAPRTKLTSLLKREEASRTGVYFLVGLDPETGRETVYIGESDDVGGRLRVHQADERKAFWEKVCLFTSKDQNLTKAHVRYLESRLLAMAKATERAVIANSTEPVFQGLPEADMSDMEYYIEQVELILPVLGMEFLRAPSTINVSAKSDDELMFECEIQTQKIKATGVERGDEFIVLKGSNARLDWKNDKYKNSTYGLLHAGLLSTGKLVQSTVDPKLAIFEVDVAFNAVSAAASVVAGRTTNGRTAWKVVSSEKTYADWQTEQVEKAAAEES